VVVTYVLVPDEAEEAEVVVVSVGREGLEEKIMSSHVVGDDEQTERCLKRLSTSANKNRGKGGIFF
jgi:hypothetical protein